MKIDHVQHADTPVPLKGKEAASVKRVTKGARRGRQWYLRGDKLFADSPLIQIW